MKEHPILFSAPLIIAILQGRKTQTRRIVKPQPSEDGLTREPDQDLWSDRSGRSYRSPFGRSGDRLWVRESLVRGSSDDGWSYAADNDPVRLPRGDPHIGAMVSWAHHKETDHCPSIHMPRWASRIKLEVTDVRIDRLQHISEDDARAEGLSPEFRGPSVYPGTGAAKTLESHVDAFKRLWDELNHKRCPWSSNPWVWVVSFKRVDAEKRIASRAEIGGAS